VRCPPGTTYALIFDPATGTYAQLSVPLLTTSPLPATALPLVESGAGTVGVATKYAREDHVHPTGGGGVPSNATPVMDGAATAGLSALYARGDHVHPTDSTRVGIANDRTALAGVNTATFSTVFLKEAGREGIFVWKTGNFSSYVAADPLQGVIVASSLVASTSGAWVRVVHGYLTPEWFGAPKNGASDDSVAINSALQFAALIGLPEVILSGNPYTIANSIVPVTGVRLRGSGAWARVNSNTNIAVLLDLAHAPLIQGGLANIKFVNASAANASAVGMKLDACQRCVFENLEFYNYDAGIGIFIQPTIVYNGTDAGNYGQDYHNFVFNELTNIMVSKCNIGMVLRGGPSPAVTTNVITLNNYHNLCFRNVTAEGLRCDWYNDNDHFYNLFVNLVTNGAVGVHLSPTDNTNWIGVAAHHFYSLTIVRDNGINPTGVYGIAMFNAPGCLFLAVGSDNQWDGTYFYNPLNVETYILSSWMHFPTSDTSANTLTNRLADITQSTMTRQCNTVTAVGGTTSTVVTFPQRMYRAPSPGFGEVRLIPLMDTGAIRFYVDYNTITATGFTIRYSAAVPSSFAMQWSAEVYSV
jgi:hypothetical protein